MCGIVGLIEPDLTNVARALEERAQRMIDAVSHRGPDGSGLWCDPAAALALAHRRLAIVDLSPAGAQPMISSDGRWVISYNGEIYNAAEMRSESELSSIRFRGSSDTEVIVESVARRGLDRTLADLNGMYAIALWDRRDRTLHLVRDRLGIKPLFLGHRGNAIWFASELKSFAALNDLKFEIEPASVSSFLRFGYVPAPWSIWKNVEKILPGQIVSIYPDGSVIRRPYWSFLEVAEAGLRQPLDISDGDAIERFGSLLHDAVSRQMISDVPLGAFLSGGIDSSLVVALMVKAARGPVRTFSIGFPDFDFDESKDAAAVAAHLGTSHTELIVDAAAALNVVPQLAEMYDEPFADSSQIPTHLVSKLTRNHVTVALSGDGGDEILAGYNRYLLADRLGRSLALTPRAIKRASAAALTALPDAFVDGLARLMPAGVLPAQLADKLKKFAGLLTEDPSGIYLRLVSQCPHPGSLALAAEHPLSSLFQITPGKRGFQERMQMVDTVTYLPDDILQKVDRASMAVALEVRPPLLDHRVVTLAWQLPRHMHIRRGETKWLMRRLLERYVPRNLTDRPKMGFGIPLAAWLRGPLRDWADDLLESPRFGGSYIDQSQARNMWREHISGRRNWAYAIWTLVMFEAWRRRWAAY